MRAAPRGLGNGFAPLVGDVGAVDRQMLTGTVLTQVLPCGPRGQVGGDVGGEAGLFGAAGVSDGASDAEGLAVAGVVAEGDGLVVMVSEVSGVWGPVARP